MLRVQGSEDSLSELVFSFCPVILSDLDRQPEHHTVIFVLCFKLGWHWLFPLAVPGCLYIILASAMRPWLLLVGLLAMQKQVSLTYCYS